MVYIHVKYDKIKVSRNIETADIVSTLKRDYHQEKG